MSENVIRAAKLGRDFKTVTALEGLDLEVPSGLVFGFLGPNGAGKTTTIRLLLAAVNVAVPLVADSRFRRNRLILD